MRVGLRPLPEVWRIHNVPLSWPRDAICTQPARNHGRQSHRCFDRWLASRHHSCEQCGRRFTTGPTESMTACSVGLGLLKIQSCVAPRSRSLVEALLPTLLERPRSPHPERLQGISGLVAGGTNLQPTTPASSALIGFTEAIRARVRPRGLGVSALCPARS
jgi:hypothetical protein